MHIHSQETCLIVVGCGIYKIARKLCNFEWFENRWLLETSSYYRLKVVIQVILLHVQT